MAQTLRVPLEWKILTVLTDRLADGLVWGMRSNALEGVTVGVPVDDDYFMGVPNAASWPYLTASVIIHLFYWVTLFKAYVNSSPTYASADDRENPGTVVAPKDSRL